MVHTSFGSGWKPTFMFWINLYSCQNVPNISKIGVPTRTKTFHVGRTAKWENFEETANHSRPLTVADSRIQACCPHVKGDMLFFLHHHLTHSSLMVKIWKVSCTQAPSSNRLNFHSEFEAKDGTAMSSVSLRCSRENNCHLCVGSFVQFSCWAVQVSVSQWAPFLWWHTALVWDLCQWKWHIHQAHWGLFFKNLFISCLHLFGKSPWTCVCQNWGRGTGRGHSIVV